jgi:hypothetical protein
MGAVPNSCIIQMMQIRVQIVKCNFSSRSKTPIGEGMLEIVRGRCIMFTKWANNKLNMISNYYNMITHKQLQ